MRKKVTVYLQALTVRVCLKAFTCMYARPYTGIQYVVHEEAKRLGRQLLKSWLTYHRIAHCARCLETGVQLRKTIIVENEMQVYLCETCNTSGKAAGAVKEALEIIKP